MRTIAIDFDGVIHDYKDFEGKGIFNPPIPRAAEYMRKLRANGWTIIIHTTREEEEEVRKYLAAHNIPFDHFNYNPQNEELKCGSEKPLADVYLDDRAICFKGVWDEQLYEKIINFMSHYEEAQISAEPESVISIMQRAIDTFEKKNQDYGNSFEKFGELMHQLLPDGILLKTVDDFNRFGVLTLIIHKFMRYINLFNNTQNFEPVQDTLRDLGVYAFMEAYLEGEKR